MDPLAQSPPRTVRSSTLVFRLLKCAGCAAGTTLVTDQRGRYGYYQCDVRIGQNRTRRTTRSIPM
jgi:hypothetical protein